MQVMSGFPIVTRQGVSLLQSVTHELGHSLGLLHSNNYRAMMSPYHKVMIRSVLQINITVTSLTCRAGNPTCLWTLTTCEQ